MPEILTEWGGPWELHRIDRSIWRGSGAFSLYPGSRFIAQAGEGTMQTTALDLQWEAGARLELHTAPKALDGCRIAATLEGPEPQPLLPTRSERPNVRLFEMPEPTPGPRRGALTLRWTCPTVRSLDWRRLSMRWERG